MVNNQLAYGRLLGGKADFESFTATFQRQLLTINGYGALQSGFYAELSKQGGHDIRWDRKVELNG